VVTDSQVEEEEMLLIYLLKDKHTPATEVKSAEDLV
jgi:hypothetical protein